MIYAHIHAAAAWEMRNEAGKAATSLGAALDLALPDALYLPFAENHDRIGRLLARALSGKNPEEALARLQIEALARRMRTGRKSLAKEKLARERWERFDGGNGVNEPKFLCS
jgi:LuxR family maltose regulon positive regulatory protein